MVKASLLFNDQFLFFYDEWFLEELDSLGLEYGIIF